MGPVPAVTPTPEGLGWGHISPSQWGQSRLTRSPRRRPSSNNVVEFTRFCLGEEPSEEAASGYAVRCSAAAPAASPQSPRGPVGFVSALGSSCARARRRRHRARPPLPNPPRTGSRARLDPALGNRGDATRRLRREPLQVSWEESHLANVGRLDEPGDPAFQTDRKAAVRRHAVGEGLQVRLVGRH